MSLDQQFLDSLKARRADLAKLLGQIDQMIERAEALAVRADPGPSAPAEDATPRRSSAYTGRTRAALKSRKELIARFLDEGKQSLGDLHERAKSYGISKRQVEHALHSLREEGRAFLFRDENPRLNRWGASEDAPVLPEDYYLVPF